MFSARIPRCALCLTLSLVLLLALLTGCAATGSRAFIVTESYAITAKNGAQVFLEVSLPVSYGYQVVSDISIENVNEYEILKRDSYHILSISIVGNGGEQVIRIRYNIELLRGQMTWQEPGVSPAYTRPGEWIDSDSEAIRQAVKPLIVAGDDLATARKISAYVTRIIRSPIGDQTNVPQSSASELLETRKGVCKDHAILMVALLRAAGIPAREIAGLAYKNLGQGGEWSHPAAAHAWVEFYIDGEWHFADPTWGNGLFDKPDGYHLSYGSFPASIDAAENQRRYAAIEQAGYTLIGAMTAPLMFTCWTDDSNAAVIPAASVEKK